MMETLSIDLPAEIAELVRSAINRGEYASSSELVQDALAEWSLHRQQSAEEWTTVVRRKVQDAIDHGSYVPMDEVFDRLEAKYQALVDAETK